MREGRLVDRRTSPLGMGLSVEFAESEGVGRKEFWMEGKLSRIP